MNRFTVAAQSIGYRGRARAGPRQRSAAWRLPMFESLTRIRAAFARASRHRKTVRALNALPTEIQKDIGWTESKAIDEIRLPF